MVLLPFLLRYALVCSLQVTHNVIWSPTAVLKKSIMMNKVLDHDALRKLVSTIVCNAEVLSHQLQVTAEELNFSQYPAISKALEDLLLGTLFS